MNILNTFFRTVNLHVGRYGMVASVYAYQSRKMPIILRVTKFADDHRIYSIPLEAMIGFPMGNQTMSRSLTSINSPGNPVTSHVRPDHPSTYVGAVRVKVDGWTVMAADQDTCIEPVDDVHASHCHRMSNLQSRLIKKKGTLNSVVAQDGMCRILLRHLVDR